MPEPREINCKTCNGPMKIERYYSPTQARYVCPKDGTIKVTNPNGNPVVHPMKMAGRKVLREI